MLAGFPLDGLQLSPPGKKPVKGEEASILSERFCRGATGYSRAASISTEFTLRPKLPIRERHRRELPKNATLSEGYPCLRTTQRHLKGEA